MKIKTFWFNYLTNFYFIVANLDWQAISHLRRYRRDDEEVQIWISIVVSLDLKTFIWKLFLLFLYQLFIWRFFFFSLTKLHTMLKATNLHPMKAFYETINIDEFILTSPVKFQSHDTHTHALFDKFIWSSPGAFKLDVLLC